MTTLQEIFLKVLINNIDDSVIKDAKEIAFDIHTGDREELINLRGERVGVYIEESFRSAKQIEEICVRYGLIDVDYEATYNANKPTNDNWGYLKFHVHGGIDSINIYSRTPLGVHYLKDNKTVVKWYTNIEEINKHVVSKLSVFVKKGYDYPAEPVDVSDVL